MVKQCFKSKLLSSLDAEAIKNAIQVAEKRTSGEIVCQVIPRSDPYRSNASLWILAGWFIATLAFFFWEWRSWGTHILLLVEWQLLGMLLGRFLNTLPNLARRTIPKKEMKLKVNRECMANFMALGLHQTEGHTGVLIFVTEFEHRVQILADSGINSKVTQDYWDNEVAQIIKGIKEGRAQAALLASIERIADLLATHFPPSTENKNELPDAVHFGNQVLTE